MQEKSKPRTLKQNASLHLWLDNLAHELNDAGYDFTDGKLIRLPVSYTKENLKESIIHPVMLALYPDIDSTADLSTTQMQEVYENVNRIIAERTGVHVPWPDHWNEGGHHD